MRNPTSTTEVQDPVTWSQAQGEKSEIKGRGSRSPFLATKLLDQLTLMYIFTQNNNRKDAFSRNKRSPFHQVVPR